MKQLVLKGYRRMRTKMAPYVGVLPHFIIIGAQKCGTTSLYEYLIKHPSIYPAAVKEVGFFDRYYNKGIKWYRTQFPSFFRKYYVKWVLNKDFITGEASTGYILNPHSLRRIKRIIPQANLILLLRNPVDRAYSHYKHTVRIGREPLSFEEAIEKEEERIGEALKQTRTNEHYYNFDIALYAYLHTGIYIDQIEVLLELFPKKQILILKSEDFNKDPSVIYKKVLHFLDVPISELTDSAKHNKGESIAMEDGTRKKLVDYFKPYNQRLYNYIGIDYGWDR